MLYSDREAVDENRCIKMALVHDLAEAETGDFVTRDVDGKQEVQKDEKEILEQEAIGSMTEDLSSRKIEELWEEYEERETEEAWFVKDMDLIEICLQALKYELDERYDPEEENENFEKYDHLDEFFATSEPRLNTDTGRDLFDKIKTRYEKAKQRPSK